MAEDLNRFHLRHVLGRLHSSNVPSLDALARRPFRPCPMANQASDENGQEDRRRSHEAASRELEEGGSG